MRKTPFPTFYQEKVFEEIKVCKLINILKCLHQSIFSTHSLQQQKTIEKTICVVRKTPIPDFLPGESLRRDESLQVDKYSEMFTSIYINTIFDSLQNNKNKTRGKSSQR